MGKLIVALVMPRNSHDGTRTVTRQNVVGDKDWNRLAIHRIGGVHTQEDTGLFLVLLAFQIGLRSDRIAVGFHGSSRGVLPIGPALIHALICTGRIPTVRGRCCFHELVYQLVFWSQHHVGCAKQGVRSGGENLDFCGVSGRGLRGVGNKSNLGTARAANPVALHCLDLLRPIQLLQVINQAIGVRGNPHHPLLQILPENGEVAALGATIGGDFLIREDRT